ncbi:MAG: PAS domain S-box protein, partial [Clostridiales bacterium]|nr:PAS domain S-box protein [Clostridiales bacterium]
MKHPEPQMKRLTVYAPVLSLCLVICIIIYYIASSALANIIKNSLEGMAVQGARTVQSETEKRLAIVRMMSRNGLVQNQDLPVEQRLYMLTAQFDATQFEDIAIADLAGNSVTMRGNSFFAGDRNYFYEALTGKETLGSPVISRSTGDLIVVFAVPVYNSGIITGVLAAAWPVEELCKITDQISITKDGFALVIDSTGAIIAHKDRTLIANDRILKEHEKDNILKSAEAAGLAMRSGKTGTIDYTSVEGESRFMGYAPIQGTNWFIGVTAPKSQVFEGTNQILVFIVICIVLFFIAVMFYNVYSNWLRNRLQSQERLTQSVIDAGGIVTLEIDKMGAVLNWNKYFESKTGYTEGDISKGSSVLEMVADEDRKRAEALLQDIREGTRQGTIELSMKGKDSRIVYLIWSIDSADNNLSDNVIELMGLDITEIMKAKNELQKKNKELSAMYDEQVALYEEILA